MSLHHYYHRQQYHLEQQVVGSEPAHSSESDVAALSDLEDDEEEEEDDDDDDDDDDDEEEDLPYPGFIPIALKYLDQNTRPRNWCLRMITNPYPFLNLLFLHASHVTSSVHGTGE
jgi:voltage-dependent calcium channel T type alpha-1G